MIRIYDVECSCGNDEVFARDVVDGQVVCDECGQATPVVKRLHPIRTVGFWPTEPKTLGNMSQRFTSQKEMDAFCEKRSVTVEPPGSAARKRFAYESEEAANQTAKEAGYRDLDHLHAATSDERRERVAANRERQSAKRVAQFGSEHAAAPDDKSAWNDALPESTKIVG